MKYYRIELARGANPRGLRGVAGRKGFTLHTGHRRQTTRQYQNVDAAFWDAIQGDAYLKAFAAHAVVNVEGPFEDEGAEDRRHFNGAAPPERIVNANDIFHYNHPKILDDLAKNNPEFVPQIRRAKRALIQGGADQLEFYVFGRVKAKEGERGLEDPARDVGLREHMIWVKPRLAEV